jgi:hypothetical protein
MCFFFFFFQGPPHLGEKIGKDMRADRDPQERKKIIQVQVMPCAASASPQVQVFEFTKQTSVHPEDVLK